MKKVIKIVLKVIGLSLVAVLLLIGGFIGYMAIQSNQKVVLPKPTGKYSVGRAAYDWTDQMRTNAFAGKPNEKRELMVMTWYPADVTTGKTAAYIPEPWLHVAEKDQSGLNGILTHKLTNVQTNSHTNVPLAGTQKTYPVIILEPGLGRASYDYSSIAEDLASHGYIVISSTPTYIADLVVFPNDKTVSASSATQLPETGNSLSPAAVSKTVQLRDVYAGDIAYLLAQVDRLNTTPGSAWNGHLDTTRIGIMGHSIGGAAAYHVCLTDTRCKVALDMDGTLFGERSSVSKVPFMFLSSDTSNDAGTAVKQEDTYNQTILDRQQAPFYRVTIRGAEHFNFSDLALRSPFIRHLGALGPINGRIGIATSRQYVVGMFDKYLEGAKAPYLNPGNALSGAVVTRR